MIRMYNLEGCTVFKVRTKSKLITKTLRCNKVLFNMTGLFDVNASEKNLLSHILYKLKKYNLK